MTKVVACNPRKNALLKEGNKSDRIDAKKLAELLRIGALLGVYHGENGVRTLKELSRSYLTISKDLGRVMNRVKALYRSWAIPCAGTQVYAPRHRSEWLGKITEVGVRRRAEHYYQQLDALQALRREVRKDLLVESRKHNASQLLRQGPLYRADSSGSVGRIDADAPSVPYQAATVDLQRSWTGDARQCAIPLCRRTAATFKETAATSRTEFQS